MARCTHIKNSGERCRANALTDEKYCLMHSPSHAEDVKEARRLGGARRRREKTVALAYDFEGLRSIADILRVLESAVSDTLALDNSVQRSRALGQLCETARRCLDRDQEERIRLLEATVRGYQPSRVSSFDLGIDHDIPEV